MLLEFQSTLPYGSEQSPTLLLSTATISIHAPLRERFTMMRAVCLVLIFQSTLPYGSETGFTNDGRQLIFQSTLPYGSEGVIELAMRTGKIFQSTLPYGSENRLIKAVNAELISIHAPLRERGPGCVSLGRGGHFNPRSLTGAKHQNKLLLY